MSNIINNGGPAFPLPPVSHDGKVVALTEGVAQGMTLRDYFAAHAPEPPHDFMRTVAGCSNALAYRVRWSWQYADAMLSARGEA